MLSCTSFKVPQPLFAFYTNVFYHSTYNSRWVYLLPEVCILQLPLSLLVFHKTSTADMNHVIGYRNHLRPGTFIHQTD